MLTTPGYCQTVGELFQHGTAALDESSFHEASEEAAGIARDVQPKTRVDA